MAGVIVIEDRLDEQCMRHVHLMGNEPIDEAGLHPFGIPSTTAIIERGETAGSHFVKVELPFRGIWNVDAACREGKFRRLVLWHLDGFVSIRDAITRAEYEFAHLFGFAPGYVFIKQLPRGAFHCQDVDGMLLLEVDWMLERSIAVGGRLR